VVFVRVVSRYRAALVVYFLSMLSDGRFEHVTTGDAAKREWKNTTLHDSPHDTHRDEQNHDDV
jgi:hypothetical protein